jgi:hypothetical protein
MTRITKLKLLNGKTLCEWYSPESTWDGTLNVWADARREIAEWADCSLSQIGTVENDYGGEFITVDDEPVAFIEKASTPRLHTFTVDLRPMLAAAE